MPAYNAGMFIKAAIDSIIQQSYQNWELIIVNDGSSDDTAAVIATYDDARIKAFQQENLGQCAAANRAFAASRGALVKFADADDIIASTMIERQVNALAGLQNTIAFGNWGRFYADSLSTFKPDHDFLTATMRPLDWLIRSMTGKQVMLQCALWLIPRNVLERSGLWNEKLSLINDFEFIIRVLLSSELLKYTPGATLYYRSGLERSLSGITSEKAVKSAYDSIDLGTRHLLNYAGSPETRRIAADCFQRFVYAYYPRYTGLVKLAENRVRSLGGSDCKFESGGYTRILVRLFGWKLAKKLKLFLRHE